MVRTINRMSCFILLLFVVVQSAVRCDAADIEALLKDAQQGGSFMPLSGEELEKVEKLFVALFQDSNKDLAKEWNALQFRVVSIQDKGEPMTAIIEEEGAKRGRGFFVFRSRNKSAMALQMPHSFGDVRTGTVGLKLFQDGQFYAAAWNTIRRNEKKDGHGGSVDLAHVTESYFTAFARAFAQSFDKGGLLQIHGFAEEKRVTAGGKGAEIIVSSGTIHPTQGAWYLDTCWEQRGKFAVRLYPTEVLELLSRARRRAHCST